MFLGFFRVVFLSVPLVRQSPLGYSVFSIGLKKYATWVYLAKSLNIAILYRFFHRFQKWYRKLNPTLLNWATELFSLNGLRKYAIFMYVDKYLNIAMLFRISPRFLKWYHKFNPTLFYWAPAFFFFKNDLSEFENISSDF